MNIVDPFDALKVQRTLVNPAETDSSTRQVNGIKFHFDHSKENSESPEYWAWESSEDWNKIYDKYIDSMDCLQRVRNADGLYIGEPQSENELESATVSLNSWSVDLSGEYSKETVSKNLMKKFPTIPLADIRSEDIGGSSDFHPSIIDHKFMSNICVEVCKTNIDPSNGKISVEVLESFVGSLFDEKDPTTGHSLFIGDIINENSEIIEFYRNSRIGSRIRKCRIRQPDLPVEYRGSEECRRLCPESTRRIIS